MINIQEIYIRASILHDDNRREFLPGDCRSNGNNGSVTYRPNEGTAIGSVDGTPVTISPKAGTVHGNGREHFPYRNISHEKAVGPHPHVGQQR